MIPMRKALILIALLLLSAMPVQAEEHETIHLSSEQAPGPVLLWQNGGEMIAVDPDIPINLDIPTGTYFFVRLYEGVPQMNRMVFNQTTNLTAFLQENLTHWSSAAGQMVPGPAGIEGGAHLDILGPIAGGEALNATWSSSTRLPVSLGHPGLADAFRGVTEQMALHGFADEYEFSSWVINNTDFSCCAYDRSEMVASNISISVFFDGPAWGWDIEADLVGQGDGRTTRLLWIPMTGSIDGDTDLRISLPAPHEIRYSPQSEHITGVPDNFVLKRGDISVTGNVTIALGTNDAPSAGIISLDRELPWLPANRPSTIEPDCQDNSISEPTSHFTFAQGNTTLLDVEDQNLTIDPFFLSIGPGWYNLTLICTDPQGANATYEEALYLDGTQPTRILQMQYLHPDDETPVNVSHGDLSFSLPSGALLSAAVQAGDDAFAPVDIEWTSDKSAGWRHVGSGMQSWTDVFIQGQHINGQHLSIDDRHTAKPLTVYSLQLNLTDAAGNDAIQQWEVTVTDHTAPNPRPAISVDGNHYGDYNHPVEGGTPVEVNLSSSWDDIDAITSLSWTVELNGLHLFIGDHWNDIQTFTLPDLPVGRHVLVVNATDSSANTGSHATTFVIEPPVAHDYSITEVVKVGDGGPGDPGALDVTVENHGSTPATFQMCYLDQCTLMLTGVGATVDGPGSMTHQIPVEAWGSGVVKIELRFEDESVQKHTTDLEIKAELTPIMWIILAMPAILGLLAFWRLKAQQKEGEDDAA
jgi:hypothetical protein